MALAMAQNDALWPDSRAHCDVLQCVCGDVHCCDDLQGLLPGWDAPCEDPVAYLKAIQLYRMR